MGAIFTSETWATCALKVIDSVFADSSIRTGIILTIVIIVFASSSDETVLTDAFKVVDEGEADSLILAGVVFAQIRHIFTVSPLKPGWTDTGIAGHVGETGCSIFTGIVFGADIKITGELAMRSMKAWRASAVIIVVKPSLKQVKIHRVLEPAVIVKTGAIFNILIALS